MMNVTSSSGNILSRAMSGVTIFILLTATYALLMFWTSINNYQSAVNVTASIENRLLEVQSRLNRHARLWSTLEFGELGRLKQVQVWTAFTQTLAENQDAAIAAYSEMHSSSPARPELGRFLAIYGELVQEYGNQKAKLELGEEVSPSSRHKLNALLHKANDQLDRSVGIMRGQVSSLTADNQAFISNGSTATVISLSLSLSTLIFLFAGLHFRQRIL